MNGYTNSNGSKTIFSVHHNGLWMHLLVKDKTSAIVHHKDQIKQSKINDAWFIRELELAQSTRPKKVDPQMTINGWGLPVWVLRSKDSASGAFLAAIMGCGAKITQPDISAIMTYVTYHCTADDMHDIIHALLLGIAKD